MLILQLFVILVFCLIHTQAGRLRFLDAVPRSRWLSFSGGVSVAYVFVQVFPEMAEVQEAFSGHNNWLVALEHQAYLIALAGLSVFYGLEKLIKSARQNEQQHHHKKLTVFGDHLGSFAIYNGLIGYLLVHREEPSLTGLLFYGLAIGLHFLVNDFGLREHHQLRYHQYGRWVLAASIVVGWVIGLTTSINELVIHSLFAFLAGSIILNVLKEELPEERKSRFLPFIIGVAAFAGLVYLQ
ncbi:hypothetical protein [Alteromonas lipotrueiana]|uniref:hypothetical protein n=1 Tax=Alteromonas lipotrueiana TaxID=2803815 RepID=UPI001C46E420|nr:hypothetical protein [Alteromonas lipotrueiana]